MKKVPTNTLTWLAILAIFYKCIESGMITKGCFGLSYFILIYELLSWGVPIVVLIMMWFRKSA